MDLSLSEVSELCLGSIKHNMGKPPFHALDT